MDRQRLMNQSGFRYIKGFNFLAFVGHNGISLNNILYQE